MNNAPAFGPSVDELIGDLAAVSITEPERSLMLSALGIPAFRHCPDLLPWKNRHVIGGAGPQAEIWKGLVARGLARFDGYRGGRVRQFSVSSRGMDALGIAAKARYRLQPCERGE